MDDEWQSDVGLVEAARARDPRAAEAIVKRYSARMHHFIAARIRDARDVEEILNETFSRFFHRSLPKVEVGGGGLAPLLYTIARNLIHDHYDKSNRLPRQISLPQNGVLSGDTSLDTILEQDRIGSALQQLTSEQHDSVLMMYGSDMTTAEIGEVLGVNERTVRRYLSAAHAILGPLLNAYEEITHG